MMVNGCGVKVDATSRTNATGFPEEYNTKINIQSITKNKDCLNSLL